MIVLLDRLHMSRTNNVQNSTTWRTYNLKVCILTVVYLYFLQTPTSAAFTAQLFDAVHGVALALSDLVNKKVISRTSDVQTVRDNLYQKLRTFDDVSTGFPSATGTGNVMFFNQNQDPPPLYDVVNLVVSATTLLLRLPFLHTGAILIGGTNISRKASTLVYED